MKQFNDPISCGYFFDGDNGLIGSGQFSGFRSPFLSTAPLLIFWTSDGGNTWKQAIVPSGGTGRVTSILMKDRFEGYASIYSRIYSLWKTTDGGKTWSDFSQGNNDFSTSVYASKNAIIKTIWFGNLGGSSTDGGKTYSQTFRAISNGSNGIDFSDDNSGIVSMGPGGGSWFTRDGGVTWSQGGTLPESWSIYAVKGSQTFLALPEDANSSGQTVYWTQNGGSSWAPRFAFSGSSSFTGHIAGVVNTLYAQSDVLGNEGLFRSDDLGQTWTNVGGPSNTRDTRFVVTGCIGQIVYAFDDHGGVWKTTDGGNGALNTPPNSGGALTFLQDSVYNETHYCQPITWTIDLINPGCGGLTIDGVMITPNPYGEFSMGVNANGHILQPSTPSISVPITFHSDSNVTRHAKLQILAHSGNRIIDTTIILVAKHSTAPEPYLDNLPKTRVGDTVSVPVFLRVTKDSFAITHFSFHLSYDGDILTPASNWYETRGTLSAVSTVTAGRPEPNGILVSVNLPGPITQDSDLTKPLIYLRMGVTLSRNMSSLILMDTFAISNSAPLPLCSIPKTEFVIDPQCGESSISAFMLAGILPKLFSVHPNPTSGTEVIAEISLPKENAVTLEFIDATGKIAQRIFEGKELLRGEHTLRISTGQLANGSYMLRMRTSDGYISQQALIILH